MLNVLLAVLLQLLTAHKGPQPKAIETFASERVPDIEIEKVLQAQFQLETGDCYFYNKVDLNGDAKDEILVYVMAKDACSSGGCHILVMKKDRDGYQVVTAIGLAWTPLVVSNRRTKGWNDLILWQRSYGAEEPSYYAVLRFDGRSYPTNPTVEPAVPLREPVEGKAYIANTRRSEFGIQIVK